MLVDYKIRYIEDKPKCLLVDVCARAREQAKVVDVHVHVAAEISAGPSETSVQLSLNISLSSLLSHQMHHPN